MHRFIANILFATIVVAFTSCGPSAATTNTPASPADGTTPPERTRGDSVTTPDGAWLPPWSFMSLGSSGVDTFQQRHPSYDGRGVVILIFDTGVDPSIPGLEKTSLGRPKVIDAIDFSRSNVIDFVLAVPQGVAAESVLPVAGTEILLRGFGTLTPAAVEATYYTGVMDESLYKGSSVRDFDGDGMAQTLFGAMLYRSADGWRVVLDTDSDGDLSDEKPVGNYRDHLQTFTFAQKSSGTSPLTLSVAIDVEKKSASFHYDMGGHGTHVAGIAAGFGINREPGFNGVAPGAQIISCKFSADTAQDITITGSMKRAYDYAARLADSLALQHKPVVVNMSFGIGSSIEGQADIERYIDSLIPAHPNLYVVTSAGNEGPGLSTIGIPAAASSMITVGAVLPEGIGRDGYNAVIDRDIIWDFSSRGGEVDKPDVLAPGTAVSTIPRYAYESRESGTSMASPYTAGVVAVLLSAMLQEDSTWVPTQELMRRALRSGGRMLDGYAPIEQGGGMLNVQRTYELLRAYRTSGYADGLQLYNITTLSPNYPDGIGSTAFWRSSYVPSGDNFRQSFHIRRAGITRSRRTTPETDFFRAYTLEPTADWLRTVQRTVYIRNADDAQVDVIYDREKMKTPGVYSARVIARRASASGPAAPEEIEFELVNTVIVPYLFDASSNYRVTTPQASLPAGLSQRYYFAPPAGCAAIRFTLSVPKGSHSNVGGKIAGQSGETVAYLSHAKGIDRPEASVIVPVEKVGKGIWEVVVQANAFDGAGGISNFSLDAEAIMLDVTASVHSGAGPRMLLADISTTGTQPLQGDFTWTIKGYTRTFHDTLKSDTKRISLMMHPSDGALWIRATLSDQAYLRATDVLFQIVDDKGNVQAAEALNWPSVWLFLPNFEKGDTTRLWLEVVFGAALDGPFVPTSLEIVENHVRPSEPRSLGGMGGIDLYPYLPQRLRIRMPSVLDTPPGYMTLGEVLFKPRGEEQTIAFEFTVP